MHQYPWHVLKFGGTSVASAERWQTISQVAKQKQQAGKRVLVVCSALSGISNQLEKLIVQAQQGEPEAVLEQIRAQHLALAQSMELDGASLLADELNELSRLALGISYTRDVGPRLRARIMALGELMSTRLGSAYLERLDQVPVKWLDARTQLQAREELRGDDVRSYTQASCDYSPNPEVAQAMQAQSGEERAVLITQGFIASNEQGETVLLGRGGSDTSCSYFAAMLEAEKAEIWTDVPGLFTANPHQVPSARLIKQVDYSEAQEMASSGAKVLHPRCIEPLRDAGIPLQIRWTGRPDVEGTRIEQLSEEVSEHGLKAITSRAGTPLLSMESMGMWQQIGFLADVFRVFSEHGLSVDQVATSETNVTVTLDPQHAALDSRSRKRLLADLAPYCLASLNERCSTISLVGEQIRSLLHEVGPSMQALEEQNIHLMTQAASDLNLTFVVDEDQAARILRNLHVRLFDGLEKKHPVFGPSWDDFHVTEEEQAARHVPAWWRDQQSQLMEIAQQQHSGPVYVYDGATVAARAESLRALEPVSQLFYAIKANPHADVLRTLDARGVNFECVSLGEIDHVLTLFPAIDRQRILFTPNFAPIEEYRKALSLGVRVTLDNIHPLEQHGEVFRNSQVMVRMDTGLGRGHHQYVRTAGPNAKFGVWPEQLEQLLALAEQYQVEIIGLHSHTGSGIRTAENWAETANLLVELASQIPTVRILNLGGGLGVPERPEQYALDLASVARSLAAFKAVNPQYELWMEPGRYFVAEAGVLLTHVTQLKQKGERRYIGVDAGMHSLLRPALYSAYHHIVNLSRLEQPLTVTADVVGPICESSDVLGRARLMPESAEGDTLLIATAGAYGHCMASNYNLREKPQEIWLAE